MARYVLVAPLLNTGLVWSNNRFFVVKSGKSSEKHPLAQHSVPNTEGFLYIAVWKIYRVLGKTRCLILGLQHAPTALPADERFLATGGDHGKYHCKHRVLLGYGVSNILTVNPPCLDRMFSGIQ